MFLSDGLGFEIKEAGLIIKYNCFDPQKIYLALNTPMRALVLSFYFRMHFCLPFHFCATGCFQYRTAIFWICRSPSGGLAKRMEENYRS